MSSASLRGLPNNPVVELLVMDSAGLEKMLDSSVLGGGGDKMEEKMDDVEEPAAVEDSFEEAAGEKKGEEGGDVAVKDSAAGDLIV